MMNLNLFEKQFSAETASHVNTLVRIMAHNKSITLRQNWIRVLVQNRLMAFLQLASIRCTALKFEMWLINHPEVTLDEDVEEEDLRWEDAGYDYDLPGMTREPQRRTKSRSPGYFDDSKLPVSRVRSMDHPTDQLLQQRQLLLPSPRHLPSAEDSPSPVKALLAAPALMVARRDPTPEFPSRLREMVKAQEDERLTELHGDFEKFRITGEQPDRKPIEERLGAKRYYSELSDYRPFSVPPTTSRTQAGASPVPFDPLGSDLPAAKRLRSTELFPDRYQVGEATSTQDPIQTKARDSVGEGTDLPVRDSTGEGTGVSVRDFAYPKDNTAASLAESGQETPSLQSDPEISSIPSSRRSAARSDSSLSSVSSTESSRARKALELTLSEDKRRVELNKGKSTASVGITNNSPSLFRSFVNAISPSSSKSSAEDVTRKLSETPTRRESRARRESGSESSLDGASESGGLVRKSSKRSRANTVPALSSKRQQKQRQTDDNTAPTALLSGIGILPEPSDSSESSRESSPKEVATEVVEELRSNQESPSVDPAESESCKPPASNPYIPRT
jgi:hypothetical protein